MKAIFTRTYTVCNNDDNCPGKSLCYNQDPYKTKCVWVLKQPEDAATRNQCLLPNHCDRHKGFHHCVTHPKIKSEKFGRCAKVSPVLKIHSPPDHLRYCQVKDPNACGRDATCHQNKCVPHGKNTRYA